MDLVTIAQFPTAAEATLAKNLLAQNDIESVLADEATGEMFHLVQPFGEVKLQVASDKAAQAREVLQQVGHLIPDEDETIDG